MPADGMELSLEFEEGFVAIGARSLRKSGGPSLKKCQPPG
jgi:hypothetical protein